MVTVFAVVITKEKMRKTLQMNFFFLLFFFLPHSVNVNETADINMLSLISVYHFNNDIWNR